MSSSRRLAVFLVIVAAFAFWCSWASAASPTVAARELTEWSTANPPAINLPAGIDANDLLLMFIQSKNTGTPNTPNGWTLMHTHSSGSTVNGAAFYRKATGTEGATVTLPGGGAAGTGGLGGYAQVWKVRTWSGTVFPEWACAAATSAAPDPPALDPAAWGAVDTLWIAYTHNSGNQGSSWGYPSGYADNQAAGWSNPVSWGHATKTSAATTENPGTFTNTYSAQNIGCTYAVLGGTAGGSDTDPSSGAGGGGRSLVDFFTGGIAAILTAILCVLTNLVYTIIAALVLGLNLIIAALAAFLAGLVALLPAFPDLPSLPDEYSTAAGWVAWVFPIGTLLAILSWFAGVWIVWQLVAIGLRWARALS